MAASQPPLVSLLVVSVSVPALVVRVVSVADGTYPWYGPIGGLIVLSIFLARETFGVRHTILIGLLFEFLVAAYITTTIDVPFLVPAVVKTVLAIANSAAITLHR